MTGAFWIVFAILVAILFVIGHFGARLAASGEGNDRGLVPIAKLVAAMILALVAYGAISGIMGLEGAL